MQGPDAARDLAARRERLFKTTFADAPAGLPGFEARHAALFDDYFTARLAEIDLSHFPPFAFMAQGGYGRSELCPHSDLDVFVLFFASAPKEAGSLVHELIAPLWDMGLRVDYSLRSSRETLALAKSDPRVLSAVLDARCVCCAAGGEALSGEFGRDLFRSLTVRRVRAFMDWLATQNLARAEEFGEGPAMLEPDLKQGLGGLRDVHQIGWLAKLCEASLWPLAAPERAMLDESRRVLLAARSGLHHLAGREQDRLFFDFQPPLAELLGFAGDSPGLRAEAFLAGLHQAMDRVLAMRDGLFRELAAQGRNVPPKSCSAHVADFPAGLDFDQHVDTAARPEALFELYEVQAETGRPLTLAARRVCARNLERGAAILRDTVAGLDFTARVAAAPHGRRALLSMLRDGALGALYPELGRVEHLVQYDGYHLHPLGRHTVEALAALHAPGGRDRLQAELLDVCERLELVDWALVYHDTGKGESGHEARGAAIARQALGRAGLGEADVEEVAWLVANHLYLVETATRRDLSDEAVVVRAAAHVGSLPRLVRLTLLTMADSRATGPKAWNSWTAQLIAELHFKIKNLLERGLLAEPNAAEIIMRTRDKVRELARQAGHAEPFVSRCLDVMSPRYVLWQSPQSILSHFSLVERFDAALAEDRVRRPAKSAGRGLAVAQGRPLSGDGVFEVAFASTDQPGLFATMSGVLALHGLNILSADIFTWRDATVIDVFRVEGLVDATYAPELFNRAAQDVRWALSGKLDLAYRLAEKRASPLYSRPASPGHPPEVRVDNGASDFFTLVEVRCDDSLGRLFDIASSLGALGLDVRSAKIATSLGQILDVFSVRDENGQKVEDPERIEMIRRVLARAAARP